MPAYAEPDIQLATLWQAMRRGFRPLLLTTVALGALTYGGLSLIASRYTSESQLEFTAKRNNPFPDAGDRQGGNESATPRLDKEAINTHARALQSPDLLRRIAGDLKLRNKAEFNSAVGSVDTWTTLQRLAGFAGPRPGESEDERVLSVVTRQIEVVPVKDTRFITIRFTSADAVLAAEFANKLTEAYRARLVNAPVEETGEVVKILTPKVEQLKREVLDAEADVDRYRATTDQFRAGAQNAPVNDQRMAALNDELIKAEAARNETESRWRTSRELLQSGSAEVLPDVQKSPLIQGLIAQRVRLERQVAEAGAALLPGHPRMQQLNADVGGLRRQITAEVQKVVQSLEKDYRSAAIRVESVTRQIDALKTRVVGQSGNEARLKELESTAKSKRSELERLQKQLEDNRTVVNIRQVPIEAQIVSAAYPSSVPTYPRKGPSTMLAMVASLILGLAFIITRALVAPAISSANNMSAARMPGPGHKRGPVEPQFSQRAMTAGQIAANDVGAKAMAATAVPLDQVPRSLLELAQRMVQRTDVSGGARTLVTAETADVDVFASALELAHALSASDKRVVLVVWSLAGRHVAVARTSLRKPGLVDLLQGAATFEQVIGRLPGSDVHIIQPGSVPADPHSILDPDRLNLTLDALDEAYDQIVVAGEFEDAQLLFEAVEGRFEAAVVVDPANARSLPTAPGVLLGYEVTEIDIVHVHAAAKSRGPGPVGKSAARVLEPAG